MGKACAIETPNSSTGKVVEDLTQVDDECHEESPLRFVRDSLCSLGNPTHACKCGNVNVGLICL